MVSDEEDYADQNIWIQPRLEDEYALAEEVLVTHVI